MSWAGEIPAGTTSENTFCSVDLLPTFANIAGSDLPKNHIDGLDVRDLITGTPGAANPHDDYPFSTARTFEGVISADGKWKLHLPHSYRTLEEVERDGKPGRYTQAFIDLSLFDKHNDPLETTNFVEQYPNVVAELKKWAEAHKQKWYPEQE